MTSDLGAQGVGEQFASSDNTRPFNPVAERTVLPAGTETKRAIVPLVLGGKSVHVEVTGSTREIGLARQARPIGVRADSSDHADDPSARPDLALIAERCKMKFESCDAVLKRLVTDPGSDEHHLLTRQIEELIARGRSIPGCFLWAPFRQQPLPAREIVEWAARAYENLMRSAELLRAIENQPDLASELPGAAQLFAQAQSSLRIAIEQTWLNRPDQDQEDAFIWLRVLTLRDQVYIPRFMRLDDPADPAQWRTLAAEITEARASVDRRIESRMKQRQALNKLRYSVKMLLSEAPSPEASRWEGVVKALQLVGADDESVPGIVRPLSALSVPREFESSLRRFIIDPGPRPLSESADIDDAVPTPRSFSESILRVRSALVNHRVVLSGGVVSPTHKAALEAAFELGDLDWVALREHASSDPLLSSIRRPNTRLVLLAVRLSGHGHIDDAQELCRTLNIPCVLLKGGLNPERVAADILEQSARALRVNAN